MTEGLRLMWKSNAPHVQSGYGVQANSLLPRLMQHPDVEDIAIFGYFGIMGGLCELPVGQGIPGVQPRMMLHYPMAADQWGNDVAWKHAQHFDADVLITLMDVWVLKDDYGHQGFLWVPYAPVDHEPAPPMIIDKLRRSFHTLAYSKHAAEEYAANGIPHDYIPHGVETKLYKPYDKGGRRQAKTWLGYTEDEFLLGTVAAHKGWPGRKGFSELFEAFARLHDRHPEARLFLHSQINDGVHGAPSLLRLAQHFGVGDQVRFTNPYLNHLGFGTREMAMVYNAIDTFVLPSMGEGFGIPIVEAQACGTPVIVSKWTACAELCGAGWLVEMGKKYLTQLESYQAFADVDSLYEQMESAYLIWKHDQDARQRLSEAARAFALQYDWETLMQDMWYPFIDWLWAAVRPKSMVRPDVDMLGADSPSTGQESAPLAEAEHVGV